MGMGMGRESGGYWSWLVHEIPRHGVFVGLFLMFSIYVYMGE